MYILHIFLLSNLIPPVFIPIALLVVINTQFKKKMQTHVLRKLL